MKTINEINKKKTPIVRIDDSLEAFKTKPIFAEKLEKANKMLSKVGLPKTGGI